MDERRKARKLLTLGVEFGLGISISRLHSGNFNQIDAYLFSEGGQSFLHRKALQTNQS